MRIAIVGTRGIPASYGGFETFAEEISPLLVQKGLDITVYCDQCAKIEQNQFYRGVRLRYQRTTKSKHKLLFYLEGILFALKENDVILVAGTAGSFFYFLNFIFRKKIITNTDGVESRRAKWSPIKRFFIKLSETLSIWLSNHLVADSSGIRDYLIKTYPSLSEKKVDVIEYGAEINQKINLEIVTKYNLNHKSYYLVVSRLEPENNLKMIIDGYKLANQEKPLIIVGNILETEYVKGLLQSKSSNIFFIGGIYAKDELMALRYSAFAYIHGHSVGGTNPSLLEALGSRNISICHDNIFNREVTDNKQFYFKDENELASVISRINVIDPKDLLAFENNAVNRIESYYTWQNIANKYYNLFRSI